MLGRMLASLPRQIWIYARSKPVTWLDDGCVAACRFPRRDKQLAELAGLGVGVLVNLHERAHPPERLARYGITELHLPVADFTPPTPAQLERALQAIDGAVNSGGRVAVHCGAGLGRTGTVLACYLVRQGQSADDAIARIRVLRPGSIETPAQEAAVHAYARHTGSGS